MMEVEQHFVYRGGGRDTIPEEATHVTTHRSVRVIPAQLFCEHPNIVELICHENVERIKSYALANCSSLLKVKMLGVRVVEGRAFHDCIFLSDIECPQLERVGKEAFQDSESLSTIDLPSAKIIEDGAFESSGLTEAKFGKDLESFGKSVFAFSESLERITFPLKVDLITDYEMFTCCPKFKGVDLAEMDVINKTIAALCMDEWKEDIYKEINSISKQLTLINDPDCGDYFEERDLGHAVEKWLKRVLGKIVEYKRAHFCALSVANCSIDIPNHIMMETIIPFLDLPEHRFSDDDESRAIYVKWYSRDE